MDVVDVGERRCVDPLSPARGLELRITVNRSRRVGLHWWVHPRMCAQAKAAKCPVTAWRGLLRYKK